MIAAIPEALTVIQVNINRLPDQFRRISRNGLAQRWNSPVLRIEHMVISQCLLRRLLDVIRGWKIRLTKPQWNHIVPANIAFSNLTDPRTFQRFYDSAGHPR
jgi:hypothetical protein